MARQPPAVKEEIPCPHCHRPSGWTKEEIIKIHGNHDLKCQNVKCKGVAIRMRLGSFLMSPVEQEAKGGRPNAPKPKYTPYQKRGKNAWSRRNDLIVLLEE